MSRHKKHIMQNIPLLLLAIFTSSLSLNSQVGGNQIYNNNNKNRSYNYNRKPIEKTSIYSTDSTLVVTAKVLLNQKADYYLITIGANQLGKTVIEVNQKINKRIDNVKQKLNLLDISNDEIYVDFISQTKQYDFKITGREVNEYFDGFNIRKNIIIKVKDLSQIENIINYCSEFEIHDIIKVDYVSKDMETINAELLKAAKKVIKNKKDVFEEFSSKKISNNYRLTYKKFKTSYPKNLYKQYKEAFETSLVTYAYNSNYNKKEVRKEKTFYYDGIESEYGVDKVIDEIAPLIGIQYILEIQVIYKLKK
jgi:uncharacterized protein YggE